MFTLYGRMCQLERWLRQMVYLELRARFGIEWTEEVRSEFRRQQDLSITYMPNTDQKDPLAYVDLSYLFNLTTKHSELFEKIIPPTLSSGVRHDEILRIRHRVAHFRAPHQDDIDRVRQYLRDMEQGSFISVASFNQRHRVAENSQSPLASCIFDPNTSFGYLVQHAANNKGLGISLETSRRPWRSESIQPNGQGTLWHFNIWTDRSSFDIPRLWRKAQGRPALEYLVFLEVNFSNSLTFTFSGADAEADIARHSEEFLRYALNAQTPRETRYDLTTRTRLTRMDPRILTDTAWNVIDSSTVPVSMFGAGGGVQETPDW